MAANNAVTRSGAGAGDQDAADGWSAILGLIIVFLEYLKWLILLPLLAGLIAYGCTFFLPKIYQSSVVFGPLDDASGGAAVRLFNTPVVLDLALAKVARFEVGKPADARRQALAARVSIAQVAAPAASPPGARVIGLLYRLDVVDSDGPRAQALANGMGEALLAQLALNPGVTEVRVVSEQVNKQLANLDGLIESLRQRIGEDRTKSPAQGGSPETQIPAAQGPGTLYDVLLRALQSRAEVQAKVNTLQNAAEAFDRRSSLAPASAPTIVSSPRRTYIVRAVAGTFVLVAIFIFLIGVVRHVIALSAARPDMAEKIARIRSLLHLRRRSDRLT